jgi:hypothetical protein
MRVNRPQTGSLGLYKPSLRRQDQLSPCQADFVCIAAIFKMFLANSENLTPQPPSLRGKGERECPYPLRGGVWGGVSPLVNSPTVSFQSLGNFAKVGCTLPQRLFN